ncbi:MAG TPA: serine/threonine-protein kinase [Solirubrobacteraceae bacterium]|nr:serine/threonine-protein kinase [Solirubrobacteraceae bacterium]
MQTTRTLSAREAPGGNAAGAQSARRAPAPDQERRILDGRYRLLETLGAGGFGVVYRAYDEELGREVAVKQIELPRLTAHAGGALALARARQEALAAARLSHPAIAALYEARVEGAALFLISELVEGASLQEHIRDRSLDERAIIAVGIALCEALEHAHERGVVHCDVTPANVLVTPAALLGRAERGARPAAKLTDFGSALIEWRSGPPPTPAATLREPSAVVGTLAYMAPEQRGGRPCGPATDLFAAALVIYVALAGENPLRLHERRAGSGVCGYLPPLARRRSDLPEPLAAALERALAGDPQLRGGIGELRAALHRAADQLEAAGNPIALGRSAERAAQRRAPSAAASEAVPLTRVVPREAVKRAGRHRPIAAPATAAAPAPASAPVLAREHTQNALRSGPRIHRRLWWVAALSAVILTALAGESALALLCLAGALPLVALPRRTTPAPALALLAPALGVVGLAGAFPALAGQARRWVSRAAIALLGAWWTLALQPLAPRLLWVWPPRPDHPPRLHASSGGSAALHSLAALASPVTAEVLAVWVLAAVLLPWVVRGRRPLHDLAAAIVWSALVVGGTGAIAGGTMPRGALLGAAAAALIAIAGRALRPRVREACNV